MKHRVVSTWDVYSMKPSKGLWSLNKNLILRHVGTCIGSSQIRSTFFGESQE